MIPEFIERFIVKISGAYSYINQGYITLYFNEVGLDIDLLGEGMDDCKFERDRNPVFQYLVEKYEGAYCPSTFYRFFSFENKFEYSCLRVRIDEILSRKDQLFSDFLPCS